MSEMTLLLPIGMALWSTLGELESKDEAAAETLPEAYAKALAEATLEADEAAEANHTC